MLHSSSSKSAHSKFNASADLAKRNPRFSTYIFYPFTLNLTLKIVNSPKVHPQGKGTQCTYLLLLFISCSHMYSPPLGGWGVI
jgi:hypothetical protein